MTEPILAEVSPRGNKREPVWAHLARYQWILPLVTFVFCAVRLWNFARRYAVNVFVGDQWFYHEPTLFHRLSPWRIFRWESNPWRQGLGGLMAAWLEPVFRWNSRVESFLALMLIIGACALALWLKVRLCGRLQAWDAVIPLLLLSPAEHESFLGVTHFSHGPLPFVLLMLIGLSFTIDRASLRYCLMSVLTMLSISTGPGFIAGLVVPPILAAGWRRADKRTRFCLVGSLGLIAAAWILFLYGYSNVNSGCPAQADRFQTHNPVYYALFSAFMLATAAGCPANYYLISATGLGFGLLTVFLYALVRTKVAPPKQAVPALLIGFSLCFVVTTALGRMCLGLGPALGSRYVIYVAPGFLGLYLLALSAPVKIRARHLAALAVLAALGPGVAHKAEVDEMLKFSEHRSAWKNCYLSKHDLRACNAQTGATVLTYPDDIQAKLNFLEEHHLNLFAVAEAPSRDETRR